MASQVAAQDQESGSSAPDGTPRSAEDLDIMVHPTKAKLWVALVASAAVLAVGLAWAFLANVPQSTSAPAQIVSPLPDIQITATVSGTVVRTIEPTMDVALGDPLFEIQPTAAGTSGLGPMPSASASPTQTGAAFHTAAWEQVARETKKPTPPPSPTPSAGGTIITAPIAGQIRTVSVLPGTVVTVGTPLAVLTPDISQLNKFAETFVPPSQAEEFGPVGSQAQISLPNGATATGTVTRVAEIAATLEEMTDVLQNPDLAQDWFNAAGGTPIEVRVDLGVEPQWASPPGPVLLPGTTITMAKTLESQRPIELLLQSQ